MANQRLIPGLGYVHETTNNQILYPGKSVFISGTSGVTAATGLFKVNIGGVWKAPSSISDIKINVGGVWKAALSIYVNVGGVWKSAS